MVSLDIVKELDIITYSDMGSGVFLYVGIVYIYNSSSLCGKGYI